MADSSEPFVVAPIGVVRSPFLERSDAPRQPVVASDVEGKVLLFEGRGFEDALSDLSAWDYIWLVVWFHHNRGFKPKVQPPRSEQKRGVFATRAPYRPNPIGISAVRLLSVTGLELTVRGLDLLDGTPVLDIKPYVPYADSIPDAGHGWLDPEMSPPGRKHADDDDDDKVARPRDPLATYEVLPGELAAVQLAYLSAVHQVELWPRIEAALALGPRPHAYRRIRQDDQGRSVLSVKDWRVAFSVSERRILVERVYSGYKPRELWSTESVAPGAHREFALKWP